MGIKKPKYLRKSAILKVYLKDRFIHKNFQGNIYLIFLFISLEIKGRNFWGDKEFYDCM
jgi:hypothetical protein